MNRDLRRRKIATRNQKHGRFWGKKYLEVRFQYIRISVFLCYSETIKITSSVFFYSCCMVFVLIFFNLFFRVNEIWEEVTRVKLPMASTSVCICNSVSPFTCTIVCLFFKSCFYWVEELHNKQTGGNCLTDMCQAVFCDTMRGMWGGLGCPYDQRAIGKLARSLTHCTSGWCSVI